MRRIVLVAAAVAVAGSLALGLYLLRPNPQQQPAGQTASAPAPAGTDQGAAPVSAAAPPSLKFDHADVDTTKAAAEACLIFNEPLDASGQTDYAAYVALKPAARVGFRVDGRRLCLAGLGFGTQYQAEIKAGLPAASGHKLANAQTTDLALSDRPPLIAFRDGLILPRESVAGIPVTTVNVDRLWVTVYRVPDRLVSQIQRDQFAQRTIYPYDLQQFREDQAATLWEGTLAVTGERNATVTTMFPIGQAVPQRKPGIYVVTAENAADRKQSATAGGDDVDARSDQPIQVQWVIETDIGLMTMRGADGLHVFARALSSALPLANIGVSLVARDNEEIARVTTDADGHARFDPGLLRGKGGAEPLAVMAYGAAGDFTFESITRPAFDLSDRGVEGRSPPGPVDVFIYADRGIYRPRETVHLVALLRDQNADAILGTPVTLVVNRPDGVEYKRATLNDAGAGAVSLDVTLGETAARGRWSAEAYLDPKDWRVGYLQFDVQDFIPQRLKVDLTATAPQIESGKPIPVDILARFLYGAPGADLSGEVEAKIEPNPTPFANYQDWRFGLVEEKFGVKLVNLTVPNTDAEGRGKIDGAIVAPANTSLPLKATLKVSIFEPGGRSTDTEIVLPLRTAPFFIGLHPSFRGGRIQEDTEAAFDVIALDADGKTAALDGLRYELVRERTEYHWYRADGRFRFERTTYDEPVTSGTLRVGADVPAQFKYRLSWGYYRLTVSDAASGAATSTRFSAGWSGDLSEDRPDKSEVSADKDKYAAGDTAKLALRPVAAGEGLLVIANDRVLAARYIHVPAEGTTVEVPVTADWGTGAYAIFASYRPVKGGTTRAPVRAIGVAWLPIDTQPRTIAVDIGAPDRVLPRQRLTVPVTVKNLSAGAQAFITLAAVDEGVLQLTRFESPNPARFYFGKRRLAVGIRDDYGRLIASEGEAGAIRQGGDIGGSSALPVVPTRTVALFSGLVAVGADGRAQVPLDIPDFEGELRLMAVAFDRRNLGQAEAHLTVRDPMVSDAVLPRFLAPGDKSRLSLSLHNVDGKPGDYRASLSAEGAVSFPADHEATQALGQGERKLLSFPLAAGTIGVGTVTLHLTGPDGFAVERQWQIAVRSAQDPVTRTTVLSLAGGKDAEFSGDLIAGYLPGTAHVSLSLATWRSLPVAGVLRSLDRYPYGCIEQTTSRAFPLLYFDDAALVSNGAPDDSVKARVQGAIDRILDMQRSDGNFGFWGPGSPANDWLSVYALDFLFAARERGYAVSDRALARGETWLRRLVQQPPVVEASTRSDKIFKSAAPNAYAAYVLARTGGATLADLRYLYDAAAARERRALPVGELAAALALAGDVARGRAGFERAETLALGPVRGPFRVFYDDDYYGSTLRDWAGLVRAAAEAKDSAFVSRLFQRYESVNEMADDLNTQEKAWLMLAEHALASGRKPVQAAVNGKPAGGQGDPLTLAPSAADLAAGYKLANAGDRELFVTVTVDGVPSEPLPPEQRGVTIERKFFALDGTPADLAQVKQNDRLIVTLQGRVGDARHHEMILRDLLPAGFEIEAAIKPDDNGATPYAWLPKQRYTRLVEARDDRYVASFVVAGTNGGLYWEDIQYDKEPDYNLAYLVRAITPGTYLLPAATIEDMYRPGIRARTAAGGVTVGTR